jgi:hypothetical protein
MFKNRWGALVFVCLIAYSAVTLVGGEDDEGILLSATEELTKAKAETDALSAERAGTDSGPETGADLLGEFSSDEELGESFGSEDYLIDSAEGFDPVPDLDIASEMGSYAEGGDVVIVVDNDEIEQ